MKNGWIVSVEDKKAGDSACKLYFLDKETLNERMNSLKERYDAIQKNRFKIKGNIPYAEVDPTQRTRLRISKIDDAPLKEILGLLSSLNPFLYKEDDAFFYIETNTSELKEAILFVKEINSALKFQFLS